MNLLAMKREAVPLHAEVATLLRNQILSGSLPSGAQIPPLRELSEDLGVARMTVRQAMDTLEDEGLIERFAGRGTFVRQIALPERQQLNMRADLSELHSMVAQLEVSIVKEGPTEVVEDGEGRAYRSMKRIHAHDGAPFCHVDLRLDEEIYKRAPERFAQNIVVSVLKELDVDIASARQKVTISYADLELAQALEISLNSPVFQVFREFLDSDGHLIYSARLLYPGDKLELDIEFSVDPK